MIFNPGDICLVQNCISHPDYNGTPCVVIGGLAIRQSQRGLVETYVIRACDGKAFAVLPYCLRPEVYQREPLARWADCHWQPFGIRS